MNTWKAIVGAVSSAVLFGALLLILLFKFVLPQFVSLFAGLGVDLPLPVGIVITISHVVRQWIFVVSMLFVVLVYAVFRYRAGRKESH